MSVRSFRANGPAFIFYLFFAYLVALLCACQPAAPPATPLVGKVAIEHFSIDVPAGYELYNISPRMMDFDLYKLVDPVQKKDLCGIFLGNFPDFPGFKWLIPPQHSVEPDREKQEFRSPSRIEGKIEFSGLSYRGSFTPFTFIHYFGDELSEREVEVIARMMRTIEVTRSHLD